MSDSVFAKLEWTKSDENGTINCCKCRYKTSNQEQFDIHSTLHNVEPYYFVIECEDLEERARLMLYMHDVRVHHALHGRVVYFDEPMFHGNTFFRDTLQLAAKRSGAKIFFACRMYHPCMLFDKEELEKHVRAGVDAGVFSYLPFPLGNLSMKDRAPLPAGISFYNADSDSD